MEEHHAPEAPRRHAVRQHVLRALVDKRVRAIISAIRQLDIILIGHAAACITVHLALRPLPVQSHTLIVNPNAQCLDVTVPLTVLQEAVNILDHSLLVWHAVHRLMGVGPTGPPAQSFVEVELVRVIAQTPHLLVVEQTVLARRQRRATPRTARMAAAVQATITK